MGKQLMAIGKQPDLTEPREKLLWRAISKVFQSSRYANPEELVVACKQHSHTIPAESFVDYCLNNGWLREVTLETE
jgi:hypothetical protein